MSHHHAAHSSVDTALARRLGALSAVLAVVVLAAAALLWRGGYEPPSNSYLGTPDEYFAATVVATEQISCPGEGQLDETTDPRGESTGYTDAETTEGCRSVTFRLDEGPDEGLEVTTEIFDAGVLPEIRLGDGLVVPYLAEAEPEFRYLQPFERERSTPLLALAALFCLVVVVQGRLRGLAALAGLAASLAVVVGFVLPTLLAGAPPVPVALVAAAVIAYLSLYLAHGRGPLTTVALFGTLASLGLTAALAVVFTAATTLSGLGEEANFIRAFGAELDFTGLLLAGTILGCLGALDDMTVTQASAVAELRAASPGMTRRELYAAAIRIGRDHVASTVNTLALAYAGASLPLLLLFLTAGRGLGGVLTSEVVATEVVRTLVGSIGLVASVPLTTALATRLLAPRRPHADPADDSAALPEERAGSHAPDPADDPTNEGTTTQVAAPTDAADEDTSR